MINSFKEINAWKKAHELVLLTYRLTHKFPKVEEFCLINQIRRAAISIPSNLAEGFRRKSRKDSNHFYIISLGSLEELRYQILLSKDLGYISAEEYQIWVELSDEAGKLINGWIKSQIKQAN